MKKKLYGLLFAALVGSAGSCGEHMTVPLETSDVEAIYSQECSAGTATAYCVVVRVSLDGQDSGPASLYERSVTTLKRSDPATGCSAMFQMGALPGNEVPHNIIIGAKDRIMLDPSCPNATTWTVNHELYFSSGRVARGTVTIENVKPVQHYFARLDVR